MMVMGSSGKPTTHHCCPSPTLYHMPTLTPDPHTNIVRLNPPSPCRHPTHLPLPDMFFLAAAFNQRVDTWDTSRVADMDCACVPPRTHMRPATGREGMRVCATCVAYGACGVRGCAHAAHEVSGGGAVRRVQADWGGEG